LAVAACFGSACGNGTPAPRHGPPILTQVYWVAGGTPQLVWSLSSDQQLQPAVPPLGTEIDFVFDRRMDGDRIEETVTIDGVPMTRPKAMGPVTATWPDMEATVPPFALSVFYSSTGRFGNDTSYVFARPAVPGFPANEKITFELDRASLTSPYGEPALEPAKPIVVTTSNFTATIAVPSGTAATDFQLPVLFSNRLSMASVVTPFIRVTLGGALVPTRVLADANDRSRIYVVPADCLRAWPARSTFVVTIDKGLPDAFGRALATDATATFTTGAPSSSTPDASCSVPDGGSDAGGEAEAGSDASDAGVDAGDDTADAGSDADASD
jgi:hypothetical protein